MASRNLSVVQLQQLFKRLPKAVAVELYGVPRQQANILANTMRQTVSIGTDGVHELRDSIRVEDGRTPLVALVKAGGPLTTMKIEKGYDADYDYALAIEFGTQKMRPRPFFWPTYRLMKRRLRANMSRKARLAIEKVVPLE